MIWQNSPYFAFVESLKLKMHHLLCNNLRNIVTIHPNTYLNKKTVPESHFVCFRTWVSCPKNLGDLTKIWVSWPNGLGGLVTTWVSWFLGELVFGWVGFWVRCPTSKKYYIDARNHYNISSFIISFAFYLIEYAMDNYRIATYVNEKKNKKKLNS